MTGKIFAGASHGITLSDKKRRRPDGEWKLDWAPGYLEMLANWIEQMDAKASP